jgi:methionine-rich copper-binding protein CopC
MKSARITMAASLLLLAGMAAQAHTHLVKSDPAQRSELAVAPKKALLAFAAPVRLTSVTVESADGKSQALKPLPAASVAEATIDMPTLSAGHYTINWRALGEDGHVMSGTIYFTIQAKPVATGD